MSKPQLPLVPDNIKGRIYKPSGKCPTTAWLLMMGIGIPAAILIRTIGHFFGLLIPLVGAIFPGFGNILSGQDSNLTCLTGIVFIAYLLMTLLASLVYPFILGGITGWVSGHVGKMGKCRSEGVSFIIGFIIAAIAYLLFALIDGQISGTVHLTSRPDFLAHMWAPSIETGSLSVWGYILVGIDGLIFTATSGVSCWLVLTHPFCEICEQWYGKWQEKRVPLSLAESLILTLSQEKLIIGDFPFIGTEYPFLSVRVRKCPICEVSDFQLQTSLSWQETLAEKSGTTKSIEKSDLWFTIMIPASLGAELLELIQAKGRLTPFAGDTASP